MQHLTGEKDLFGDEVKDCKRGSKLPAHKQLEYLGDKSIRVHLISSP